MKDPRGVERGACKSCDCTAYELEAGATRAQCSYCECPAPSHEAVATKASEPTPSTSTVSDNTSFSSIPESPPGSSSTSTPTVILDVHNVTDPFLQGLLSNTCSNKDEPNTDEIFLPATLPKKYQLALDQREVDHKVKAGIVREVCSNLVGHNQTDNKFLQKAAKKMVARWSPLKDPLDPENQGLQNMLRKRRERVNAVGPKPVSDTILSASDAKKLMFDKWTNEERSTAAHKKLMELARPLRQQEAKKLPGLNLLRAYPALGLNDILLSEFLAEVNITYEDGVKRWATVVQQLLAHYKDNQIPYLYGTLEEESLCVLESIHLASTVWFKEKNRKDRKARILELFPDNTPIAEVQTAAKEAPRLIGIGSYSEGSLTLSCFVDSEPWFKESDPIKALFLLLGIYFVVGIKWGALTKLPMLFLTCATVGPLCVRSDIVRNQKLVDFAKKMKAYM